MDGLGPGSVLLCLVVVRQLRPFFFVQLLPTHCNRLPVRSFAWHVPFVCDCVLSSCQTMIMSHGTMCQAKLAVKEEIQEKCHGSDEEASKRIGLSSRHKSTTDDPYSIKLYDFQFLKAIRQKKKGEPGVGGDDGRKHSRCYVKVVATEIYRACTGGYCKCRLTTHPPVPALRGRHCLCHCHELLKA